MTTNDQITFFADHRPALEDGDYTITVTQTITAAGKIDKDNSFSATRNFSVLGPRFSLDPQEIRAVFPPDGSLGEHSNVLPHIIFNRATLPWERSANGQDDGPPWLALLVFNEGEEPIPVKPGDPVKAPALQTVSLGDLGFPQDNKTRQWGQPKITSAFYKGLTPESGQHANDQVQIITISATLLKNIIPTRVELDWLAHARQATDASGAATSDPFAVLFANRLPTPNGHTTVHLVSLEGLYDSSGVLYYNKDENKNLDPISLVSLKSWRFACVSPKHDLKNLLLNLDAQSFHMPIQQDKQPTATPYLKQGLAPFAHAMRQGNRSVSWYRGPLLPSTPANIDIRFPVPNADSLVRYYNNIGMFDVTYAAAWELGRLLALQNKRVSVDLFNWKRAHAQQQKDAENQLEHLPLIAQPNVALDLPASVTTWYQQLNLLNGIPFNYLVPDEKFLPAESIRFFQVDPLWVECLLDGAFAVGRVLEEDQNLKNDGKAPVPIYQNISGFLLRSAVVAGYPDLQVDGFDIHNTLQVQPDRTKAVALTCLRMERLSSNVLLCLFDDRIAMVDIHQKPESMHFGFNTPDQNHPNYYKTLRDPVTGIDTKTLSVAVSWRATPNELQEKLRVVDIDQLQKDIKSKLVNNNPWNVAQFAMQMIEGVEQVQFSIG